jgi:hypothetical protein
MAEGSSSDHPVQSLSKLGFSIATDAAKVNDTVLAHIAAVTAVVIVFNFIFSPIFINFVWGVFMAQVVKHQNCGNKRIIGLAVSVMPHIERHIKILLYY